MDIPFIEQLALKQNINTAEVSVYIETFVFGFASELEARGKISFDPFGIFEIKKELEYIKEEEGCKILMPPRLEVYFNSSAILGVLASDNDDTTGPLYEVFSERHEWSVEAVTLFIAQIKSVVKSALLKDKRCYIPGFGGFEGELGGDIDFRFEETFKELINKPFSHFKPVELSCSEKELASVKEGVETQQPSVSPTKKTVLESVQENRIACETPVMTEEIEEVKRVSPTPSKTELQSSSEDLTPLHELTQKLEAYDKRILLIEQELNRKNKVIRRLRWGLLIISLLVVLFLILTYYVHVANNDEIATVTEEVLEVKQEPIREKTFAELEEDYLQQTDTTNQLVSEETSANQIDSIVQVKDTVIRETTANVVVDEPRMHVLKRGETLRSLAERYYNNKEDWSRIVKANSEIITDPNQIPIGTTLRIPK